MDVRMPDGTIIKNVPEGTTRSQLQARLDKANRPTGYNETAVAQGLSGANEGLANTLGLPVDMVNSALDIGYKGVNALAGTNLQASERPFLGSEYIKQGLTKFRAIGPESTDPAKRFVRRVGQSVGSAAVPIAATAQTPAMAARALIPAAAGGVGAAVAKDVAPDSPLAELGGEVVGSILGGGIAYSAAKRSAEKAARARVPTVEKLKRQAASMYDLAEKNGVRADQGQTAKLAATIKQVAIDEGLVSPTGRVSEAYPKAKEAMNLTADYANGEMTPKQMQTVRKVLSEAAGSADDSERRIARKMLEQFDDWTAPLAPELRKARSIARRYINAGKLEEARELAGASAKQFSGSGYENALRTEYRKLDRQIIKGQERGFTPETVAAIQDVARGTKASNAARFVGKAAPTGTVSTGASFGVPFAVGNAIGGPVAGMTLGTIVPTVGAASRAVATRMGINNAQMAEMIARNGGNLPPPLVLTPEIRRLLAAQSAGQLGPYSNRKKVKDK